MGGKVLVPTFDFINKLTAARLAADVAGVPTVLIARTDADSAKLLTSDFDERDKRFCTGERTSEGFFRLRSGIGLAISRALSYAPLRRSPLVRNQPARSEIRADISPRPSKKEFPDRMLAYNCSPSFNWSENLDETTIARFQDELASMGYKYQFVTLAGFHAINYAMWKLARGYCARQMDAYTELQDEEFEAEAEGYMAVKHQSFVGAGYFDEISQICNEASTVALTGSTEAEQFSHAAL